MSKMFSAGVSGPGTSTVRCLSRYAPFSQYFAEFQKSRCLSRFAPLRTDRSRIFRHSVITGISDDESEDADFKGFLMCTVVIYRILLTSAMIHNDPV